MTIEQAILERLRALPPSAQREVLDFTEFLAARLGQDRERDDWSEQSLAGALVDMDDEPELYSEADLKERLR
jgi:hypothetical protein